MATYRTHTGVRASIISCMLLHAYVPGVTPNYFGGCANLHFS